MRPTSSDLRAVVKEQFGTSPLHGWTGYHTSTCTEGALVSAGKPA
jgi:hypothetical protein